MKNGGPPEAGRQRAIGQVQAPQRRLPSLRRFTYPQSFFVMTEGPIGVLPKIFSSVSMHPLKLTE